MGEVMPLTPEDVSNKRFTPVRLREGYDMGEVDQFLDEVEAELARLTKENEELRSKVSAAQQGGGDAPTYAQPDPEPYVAATPEPEPEPQPGPDAGLRDGAEAPDHVRRPGEGAGEAQPRGREPAAVRARVPVPPEELLQPAAGAPQQRRHHRSGGRGAAPTEAAALHPRRGRRLSGLTCASPRRTRRRPTPWGRPSSACGEPV